MEEEINSLQLGLKMWFTAPSQLKIDKLSETSKSSKKSKSASSLFGPGDILLLRSLKETENLTQSAKELGYSYKYAWQKLKNLSRKTKRKVVEASRGGYQGGGKMLITEWGKYLIKIYDECSKQLHELNKQLNQYLVENPFSP